MAEQRTFDAEPTTDLTPTALIGEWLERTKEAR